MEQTRDTFRLVIRRAPKFTGMALKTRVLINGATQSKVAYNSSEEFVLPRNITQVKLYNIVPLGKDFVKEIVVDPMQNRVVEMTVTYKTNWLAMIPPLLFFIPTSHIIVEMVYFE